MDFSHIHVHDGQLLRVIEYTKSDMLTMDVELPVDEEGDEWDAKLMVFEDAHNYQVHEGPFCGNPTILDMKVIGQSGRWWQVRMDTNAGYREWYCTGFKILPRD